MIIFIVGNAKASLAYTTSLIGIPQLSSSSASSQPLAKKAAAKEDVDVFKEPQSGIRIMLVSHVNTLLFGLDLISLLTESLKL
jgi:hypothetical protein